MGNIEEIRTLTYEVLELLGDPGQTIFVYVPEPDSASDKALKLLASWTATHEVAGPTHVTER